MSQKSLRGAMSRNKTRRTQKGGASIGVDFPELGPVNGASKQVTIEFNGQVTNETFFNAFGKPTGLNAADYEVWYKSNADGPMRPWTKFLGNGIIDENGASNFKYSIRRTTDKKPSVEPCQNFKEFTYSPEFSGIFFNSIYNNYFTQQEFFLIDRIRTVRGGGNCYYISVMYGLFESIISKKDHAKLQEVLNIITKNIVDAETKKIANNNLLQELLTIPSEYLHFYGTTISDKNNDEYSIPKLMEKYNIELPKIYRFANFKTEYDKFIAKVTNTIAFLKNSSSKTAPLWENVEDFEKDFIYLETKNDVNSAWLENIMVLILRLLISINSYNEYENISGEQQKNDFIYGVWQGDINEEFKNLNLEKSFTPSFKTNFVDTATNVSLITLTIDKHLLLIKDYIMKYAENSVTKYTTFPSILFNINFASFKYRPDKQGITVSDPLAVPSEYKLFLHHGGNHYNLLYENPNIISTSLDKTQYKLVAQMILQYDLHFYYDFIKSSQYFNDCIINFLIGDMEDTAGQIKFTIAWNKPQSASSMQNTEERFNLISMDNIYRLYFNNEKQDTTKIIGLKAPQQKWTLKFNKKMQGEIKTKVDDNDKLLSLILNDRAQIGLGNSNYTFLEWIRKTYCDKITKITKTNNNKKALYFVCENVIIPHDEMNDYNNKRTKYETDLVAFMSSTQCNCNKNYTLLFTEEETNLLGVVSSSSSSASLAPVTASQPNISPAPAPAPVTTNPSTDFTLVPNPPVYTYKENPIRNGGSKCYFNAIIQCLMHSELFINFLLKYEAPNESIKQTFFNVLKSTYNTTSGTTIDTGDDHPFTKMQTLTRGTNTIIDGLLSNTADNGRHQDASEFFGPLIDSIETELCSNNSLEQQCLEFEQLFYNITRKKTTCKNCDYIDIGSKYKDLDFRVEIVGFNANEQVEYWDNKIKYDATISSCNSAENTCNISYNSGSGNLTQNNVPFRKLRRIVANTSVAKLDENYPILMQKLFDTYFDEEIIEEQNYSDCKRCKTKNVYKQQLILEKCPQILICYPKRFVSGAINGEKTNNPLDVSKPENNTLVLNGVNYELFATANHSGGVGGGHYIAWIKNGSNVWMAFDDGSAVQNASTNTQLDRPYVLFYKRTSTTDKPETLISPRDLLESALNDPKSTQGYIDSIKSQITDLRSKDNLGRSLLFPAALSTARDNRQIIQQILDAGADPLEKDTTEMHLTSISSTIMNLDKDSKHNSFTNLAELFTNTILNKFDNGKSNTLLDNLLKKMLETSYDGKNATFNQDLGDLKTYYKTVSPGSNEFDFTSTLPAATSAISGSSSVAATSTNIDSGSYALPNFKKLIFPPIVAVPTTNSAANKPTFVPKKPTTSSVTTPAIVAVAKTSIKPLIVAVTTTTTTPLKTNEFPIIVEFSKDATGVLSVKTVNIDVNDCASAIPFPDDLTAIDSTKQYLFTIQYDPANPFISKVAESKTNLDCSPANNFKTKLGELFAP